MSISVFFLLITPSTTRIYTSGHTLSLPDSLPIYTRLVPIQFVARYFLRRDLCPFPRVSPIGQRQFGPLPLVRARARGRKDRKSTRLNSSHSCAYSMPSSA